MKFLLKKLGIIKSCFFIRFSRFFAKISNILEWGGELITLAGGVYVADMEELIQTGELERAVERESRVQGTWQFGFIDPFKNWTNYASPNRITDQELRPECKTNKCFDETWYALASNLYKKSCQI